MSRIRIEGLLAAFPKLVGTGKQHTYVETENVRYLYQPIEVRCSKRGRRPGRGGVRVIAAPCDRRAALHQPGFASTTTRTAWRCMDRGLPASPLGSCSQPVSRACPPARPRRLCLPRLPAPAWQTMYLVLVTNKSSNILEDLETLRLCGKIVPEYVEALEEEDVSDDNDCRGRRRCSLLSWWQGSPSEPATALLLLCRRYSPAAALRCRRGTCSGARSVVQRVGKQRPRVLKLCRRLPACRWQPPPLTCCLLLTR